MDAMTVAKLVASTELQLVDHLVVLKELQWVPRLVGRLVPHWDKKKAEQ